MATAKNLIEELAKLPPDTKVFMASDPEGNKVYELDEVSDDPKAGSVILWPGSRVPEA